MNDSVLINLEAIAPELAETPDIVLGVFYDIAVGMVNTKAFGSKSDLAIAYYMAHLITMRGIIMQEGATSAIAVGSTVVMEKEDELQRQYGAPSIKATDSTLSSTYYGRMFIELRNSCVIPVMTRLG